MTDSVTMPRREARKPALLLLPRTQGSLEHNMNRHSEDQHCWQHYKKVCGGPHRCRGCHCYGTVMRKRWLCVHCWSKDVIQSWESLPCRACIGEYDLQIANHCEKTSNDSGDKRGVKRRLEDSDSGHKRGLKRRLEDSDSSSSFSEGTTRKLNKFLERREATWSSSR